MGGFVLLLYIIFFVKVKNNNNNSGTTIMTTTMIVVSRARKATRGNKTYSPAAYYNAYAIAKRENRGKERESLTPFYHFTTACT